MYQGGQGKEPEEGAQDKAIQDIQVTVFRNKNNLGFHSLINLIPCLSPFTP